MLLATKLSFFLVSIQLASISCEGNPPHDAGHNEQRSRPIEERSFSQQPQALYDFSVSQTLPQSQAHQGPPSGDHQEPQQRSGGSDGPAFPPQTSFFFADGAPTQAPQSRTLPQPRNQHSGHQTARNLPSSEGARQAAVQPAPENDVVSFARSFFSRQPVTFPPAPQEASGARSAPGAKPQPPLPQLAHGAQDAMTRAVFKGAHQQQSQERSSSSHSNLENGERHQAHEEDTVTVNSAAHAPAQPVARPVAKLALPQARAAPAHHVHAIARAAPIAAHTVAPAAYSYQFPAAYLQSPEVLHYQAPLYAPTHSLGLTAAGYGITGYSHEIILPEARSIHTVAPALLG